MATGAGQDVALHFPLPSPEQQRSMFDFQILSGFPCRQPSGMSCHKIASAGKRWCASWPGIAVELAQIAANYFPKSLRFRDGRVEADSGDGLTDLVERVVPEPADNETG